MEGILLPVSASEYLVHRSIVDWLNDEDILYFHIPNGELRNKRTGSKLKKLGVLAGVPDLQLFMASKAGSSLFIEVKRNTKAAKLSKNQLAVMSALERHNHRCAVAQSLSDAKLIIELYQNSQSPDSFGAHFNNFQLKYRTMNEC